MKTAADWKVFYAQERASLGAVGLAEQLDRAPDVALPDKGALVFPHTRMAVSGHLTAAVARAVVRSRAQDVLALGVLHGGAAADAGAVTRARSGHAAARADLRRVYPADHPFAAEEFSLDGFVALLELAAARASVKAPRVHARYPFLVGDEPADLPGMAELEALASRMPVVATTDPLHHGAGYETPEGQRRDERDPATLAWASRHIQTQLDLLCRGDWPAFQRLAAEVRSDFRDTGPVLAHLLRGRGARGEIVELELVDYAVALGAARPTWVAGSLLRLG